MGDKNAEQEKRKRSENSSVSELDSSVSESIKMNTNTKGSKQKKKKSKTGDSETDELLGDERDPNSDKNLKKEISSVIKQMNQINSKLERVEGSMKTINKSLENVMMKGDDSMRSTMKEIIREMKDEFLKSVEKSIEVIESRLFDKERDSDEMKKKKLKIEKEIDTQKDMFSTIQNEIARNEEKRIKSENDTEQYGRRNNLKISGLSDTNPRETARETANKVINLLKDKKVCELTMADIDVAHRLPNKLNKNREVIVKLVSRNIKDDIIRNRKNLKGTGIFINEDLTRMNFHVYMCVKKKMPDEITQAWTKNGTILYRNAMNVTHVVKFEEFGHWTDLPWPNRTRN